MLFPKRGLVVFAALAALLCNFLLLPACGPKSAQPTVPAEKLARVMADLYIAEAATQGLAGYQKDSLLRFYNRQVFEIHGLTPAEYQENLRLFSQNESDIDAIVKRSVELVSPADSTGQKAKSDKADD